MFVDIFFAIDKNLSLGPKRSIARNFWKISCSHGDRRLWITFLSNINCDKPPGTVFKCQKGSLPITVEVIIAFLHFFRTWEVVEKTIFQKKRHSFQWGKKYGPLFLVLSTVTNRRVRFIRVFKVFSPLLCLL